jgi:phycocyanobilin lyase beta subunit
MTTSATTSDLIRAVEEAGSAEAMLLATVRLAEAAGQCPEQAAVDCLVGVLGFNNPGAAVAAVEGLIRLGEVAVAPLLSQLDPRNYGARAWAVRALAGIGDVRGLELLEEALATDVGPSVRRAAACGLGQLRLDGLPPGQRDGLRNRCLEALVAGQADGEWVVRYAVVVGLERLAGQLEGHADGLNRARATLVGLADPGQEAVPVVRLRAERALASLPC